MTTISRHLRLQATTSPVTSNTDKNLMMQAAEQIEHLQKIIERNRQKTTQDDGIAPWETR
jgi:hypothetical protein